jgi:hypothetical protein
VPLPVIEPVVALFLARVPEKEAPLALLHAEAAAVAASPEYARVAGELPEKGLAA